MSAERHEGSTTGDPDASDTEVSARPAMVADGLSGVASRREEQSAVEPPAALTATAVGGATASIAAPVGTASVDALSKEAPGTMASHKGMGPEDAAKNWVRPGHEGATGPQNMASPPPARDRTTAPAEGRSRTAAAEVARSAEAGASKAGTGGAVRRWVPRVLLGLAFVFVVFFLGYLADAAMSGGTTAVRLRLAAMVGVHGTVDGPSNSGVPDSTPGTREAGGGGAPSRVTDGAGPTHGTDGDSGAAAPVAGEEPERPAVCAQLSGGAWETIRTLAATQLTVNRTGDDFIAGSRSTVAEFLGLGDGQGRPAVLVLGQLACRPCMEELPVIGTAATEHPAVRIAEVLLESDWDGQGVPYAGGNARRIAQSGLPVAAVAHPDIGRLVRRIPGLSFPAFVFVSSTGNPERICFGAVTIPTPEGKEFTQWLNRASVRIP